MMLIAAVANDVLAQQSLITVSGVVKEKGGEKEPLAGIAVVATNMKSVGMSTDANGKFTLKVLPGSTLKFSCVGFKPITMKVKSATSNLVIEMEEDSQMLNEVVTIGYVKRHKADVTSAVSVINTEDLTKAPVSNVVELLQGRVAGLDIQLNNGTPGSIGTLSLRGVSDISVQQSGDDYYLSSSNPLFVIDGIPQDDVEEFDAQGLLSGSGVSPLSSVPFEDIADIQVLKDAAATSLYGSRGAYGVILINTKKGSGAPKVSYSADLKVNTPPRLRDVVAGKEERMMRIRQILENDTTSFGGYDRLDMLQALTDSLNPYFNNNTNWQDNFYRTTFNQTHNLAVSGGIREFDYKVNANYYTEDGILKNTSFDRYGLRTGMGWKPNDKFNLRVSINATLTKQGVGSGNSFSQSGVASGSSASSLLPPPSMYSASSSALSGLMVETDVTSTSYDASVVTEYKLPFNIRWNATVGLKTSNTETSKFTPALLNNAQAKNYGVSSNSNSIYVRTGLGYSGTISIPVLPIRYSLDAGIEYSQKNSNTSGITLNGLPSDYIHGPFAGSSEGSSRASNAEKSFAVSLTPSIRLGDGRYVFNPSIRPEANSVYGRKVKWVVNPGLGLGWNYSQEKFISWPWLNRGSIRATWGRTTKYRATRYDIWGTYPTSNNSYNGATIYPIDFSHLPNIELDPVTSTTWNLGTDMNILNNLLRFDINVYYKQVDNQLSSTKLADHNAFTDIRTTEVSLVNYGFEFEAGVRPIQKKNLSMNINFNFAIKKDVVAKLPDEARQIINSGASAVNRLGGNALGNYLYIYKGVYANDEDVPVDPATGRRLRVGGSNVSASDPNAYFKAGDPIWVDLNGDYVIDEKDKTIIGNSQPMVTGGLSFNVRYKNVSLFTSCSFSLKRDIINKVLADNFKSYNNPAISISQLASGAALVPISAYNFWTPENRDADYPNPYDFTRSKLINPFRPDQTLFMEDGSYFKINGITVQFQFPDKWTKFLHIRSASIRANLSNIYTFSKYSGINPESVNSLGWDTSGGYPNARNFSMGVNINF